MARLFQISSGADSERGPLFPQCTVWCLACTPTRYYDLIADTTNEKIAMSASPDSAHCSAANMKQWSKFFLGQEAVEGACGSAG